MTFIVDLIKKAVEFFTGLFNK
ncbi:epsilon family phenol-soluble modulin [Staphylococcus canis]|uniref:Epsilon family phenol-soluble modulin n=1 Tax=Staphylococcus canis TaxID=2724942 RepID=A0ABS0T8F7_9STAP|nr:epsilon family phenol-soluble modulin [Staphylococcus canis]